MSDLALLFDSVWLSLNLIDPEELVPMRKFRCLLLVLHLAIADALQQLLVAAPTPRVYVRYC